MGNITLETAASPPRKNVGPFVLEGVLGAGGMGIVFRARDPSGRAAAVKLLEKVSPERLERFRQEAGIRIQHPNVVQVLDAGQDEDGTPYIAFELLEGETLEDRLSRGPLAPATAVDVAVQTCAGLTAAHALGVIHRDLKPGNVFCTAAGPVKLLDFGIALLSRRDQRLTVDERRVLGTPNYLSPEQARGDSTVDGRTDLWALGVMLYEALSGARPFERDSELATILAVILDELVPLQARSPTTPPAVAAVIERALMKAREQRWSSAEAFAAAIAKADLTPGADLPDAQVRARPVRPSGSATQATVALLRVPRWMAEGEQRVVALLLAEGVIDLDAIRNAVEQRGGVLIPLLGKRAIGLFGGEAWEGDEVVRAAAAALYARGAAERMAVASGRAERSEHGIAGAAIRAAESGCRAGLAGVAVDPQTARAIRGGFAVRSLGNDLHELTAERPPIWPLAPLQEGEEPSILGREVELAHLKRGLRVVLEEGRAAALLVTGPPGIGKSRLRLELERLVEASEGPVHMLLGRADPLRRNAALGLVASALSGRARLGSMLRGWPRLGPEAPLDERQAAVRQLVGEAVTDPGTAGTCADFLGELLDVQMPSSPTLEAARRDPQLMSDRLLLAVRDYFSGVCERGPVALLIEDLQWADPTSLDVLEDLLDRLADLPLLVFATARPELDAVRPTFLSERDVQRVDVKGLSHGDVATLARAIAGRAIPDALARAVAERTGGNPLFVEQIVLALREDCLLDSAPETLPLPLTVEAAVQSRLDHLPPEEKELCKLASVYGRPFTAAEVEALGVSGAQPMLVSLGKRELLSSRVRAREGRGKEYRFSSALVSDVGYRMIADDRRGELHRRAAAFLDRSPDSNPEEIALHHEKGGEPAQAAERYAAAALAAAGKADAASVLRCSERALALGAPDAMRFALHMARADALRFAGKRNEQGQELEAALGATTDPGQRARALNEHALWLLRTGQPADALATAQGAVDSARAAADPEALALARGREAIILIYMGRLPAAKEALAEAGACAQEGSTGTRALASEWRGQLASALGDIGERRDAYCEAAALHAAAGDIRRAVNCEINLADADNRVGAYAEAEGALRTAHEGARRVGNRIVEGYALLNLGYALTRQGRHAEARETLQQAATQAAQMREVRLSALVRVYEARARLGAGEVRDALVAAEAAVEEAGRSSMPSVQVGALVLAAAARHALGDVRGALALSEKALSLRDQLGSIEEDEAEVFLVHGRLLSEGGQPDRAGEVFARGRARVRELAEGIRDEALRARFLKDVRDHRELLATETATPA